MNDTDLKSPPLSQTDVDSLIEEQEDVGETTVVEGMETVTTSEYEKVSAGGDAAVESDETEEFSELSSEEMDFLFTEEEKAETPAESASDEPEEFSVLSQQDMDDLIMEVDDTSEVNNTDGSYPTGDDIIEKTGNEPFSAGDDADEPENRPDAPDGIIPIEEWRDDGTAEKAEPVIEKNSAAESVVSKISPPALKEIQADVTEGSPGDDLPTGMPEGPDQKTSGKKTTLVRVSACILVLACLGTWIAFRQGADSLARFFPNKGTATSEAVPAETLKQASHGQSAPLPEPSAEQPADRQPEGAVVLPPVLEDPVKKADMLRQSLSAKQKKLDGLQIYYKNGISEMQERVLHEIRDKHILSYEEALQNQSVALALHTIRRRQTYIANLKNLSRRISDAGEQLLYLKRQAVINALVGPVTDGLDNGSLAEQIHHAILTHTAQLENIVFGIEPNRMEPLASIWNHIVPEPEKRDTLDAVEDTSQESESGINGEISDEICSSDLSRKHLITVLTEKTAICLSKWGGNDLMINGLKNLSSEAAAHLSRWKGDWLCLNGVTTLSAGAAKHLFRWKGQRLSLNGVAHLTPAVSGHIPGWTGKHLELTGLTDLPFETASDLVKWQASGGKVYVAERLQR